MTLDELEQLIISRPDNCDKFPLISEAALSHALRVMKQLAEALEWVSDIADAAEICSLEGLAAYEAFKNDVMGEENDK